MKKKLKFNQIPGANKKPTALSILRISNLGSAIARNNSRVRRVVW